MSWGIGDRVGVAVSAGTIATFNSRRKSPVPSLVLDFAGTGTLDPRVTFTRSTTGVYYNGTTTALAEQNLLLQSQSFSTSPWVNEGGNTVTLNSTIAPDGTSTGATILWGTAGKEYQPSSQPTLTANQYTASCYFKSNTDTSVTLNLVKDNAAVGSACTFNLSAGTAGSITNYGGTTGSTVAITSAGNGWYRCSITVLTTATSTWYVNIAGITIGNSIYAWGAQLEQRSSATAYNATTTAIVQNYIPQLLTAAINAPRFDYNPVTSTALGLLIEQSSTNLYTYSQTFISNWNPYGGTLTISNLVGPDGSTTGALLNDTDATAYSGFSTTTVISASTNYTCSAYVKQGSSTGGFCIWLIGNNGTIFQQTIAWTAGVPTATGWTATAVGNGWYRISYPFNSGTNTTVFTYVLPAIQLTSATGSTAFWGFQLEALPFATSYIATVASQVTRAVDLAYITGANFSSWYNPLQGTLYAETIPRTSSSSFQGITSLSTGTSSQANEVVLGFTYPSVFWSVDSNGSNQGNSSIGTAVQNSPSKIAISFVQNSILVNVNGVSTATGSPTAKVPLNITTLTIGYDPLQINPRFLVGTIKKISFYPIALNASQLVTLNTP